jgi:general secretion pathway protein C
MDGQRMNEEKTGFTATIQTFFKKKNLVQRAFEAVQNKIKKNESFDIATSTNFDVGSSGSGGSGGGSNNASIFKKSIQIQKPQFEKYLPYIIGAFIGYVAADLTVTSMRSYTIPTEAPPARARVIQPNLSASRLRSEYDYIAQRNIFNSDGVIPKPIGGDGTGPGDQDSPAVPTQLPLTLVGTIVHVNPAKSVATVEVKSAGSKIIPYIPNDEIEGIATLMKVERKKIFIRNKNNGRMEYLEMKDTSTLKFGLAKKEGGAAGGDIVHEGNNFSISRKALEGYLGNISDVLQQARMVPNRDPATGEINGFRFLWIKPDSIFGQLGFGPGDLLKSVNGSPVTSAQQALEMYQNLKSADSIIIRAEKDGREQDLNYQITK